MKISPEAHQAKKSLIGGLDTEREQFKPLWRDLADYILPTRYAWLLTEVERRKKMTRNPNIIDATATLSARVLASGMLNGITSPSRPWFKLRVKSRVRAGRVYQNLNENYSVRRWLDEVERLMLQAMADTNFYNALATMYLDLVIFGTSAVLIYEDYRSVFRCYNASLGEYYLANSSSGAVNTFARQFRYTASQIVERWGAENVTESVRVAVQNKDAKQTQTFVVNHLIEPNDAKIRIPSIFNFRELYWLDGHEAGSVLDVRGFNELPGIFPRWEVSGSDSYGSSPGMDALGDVIQLQHESKRKAQGLDFMLKPPMKMDIQLQNKPSAFIPGGVTYLAGVNNAGAEPLYQVNMPIGELTADIRDVQSRVRMFFHNDLFTMISNLETVRTATEIDARREEKLIQLGPVLERFENEALDPAIARIYAIMKRAGMIPPPPEGLEDEELEIQYVSILSTAQSAVGVAPTERWIGLIGNIASAYPAAVNIVNWDDLIRDYGRDVGVKAKHILSKEEAAEATARQEEMLASREAVAQGAQVAQGAETLSKTDVGGGANALQVLMGANG